MTAPLVPQVPDLLREFVEGNQFAWDPVAGGRDLLRQELRQLVEQADAEASACLEECWGWLSDERAARRMAAYCHVQYPCSEVASERLHRNARALVATAQAAVAVRQVVSNAGAFVRAARWGQEASRLLGGPLAGGAAELTCRWTEAEPVALVRRIYAALAELGWRVAAALDFALVRHTDRPPALTRCPCRRV